MATYYHYEMWSPCANYISSTTAMFSAPMTATPTIWNCRVVFDKVTHTSSLTSNLFRFFILTEISSENLDSQSSKWNRSIHSSLYQMRVGLCHSLWNEWVLENSGLQYVLKVSELIFGKVFITVHTFYVAWERNPCFSFKVTWTKVTLTISRSHGFIKVSPIVCSFLCLAMR